MKLAHCLVVALTILGAVTPAWAQKPPRPVQTAIEHLQAQQARVQQQIQQLDATIASLASNPNPWVIKVVERMQHQRAQLEQRLQQLAAAIVLLEGDPVCAATTDVVVQALR
jgi:septal ring factor EnvC (AmiA/AmiB activator)